MQSPIQQLHKLAVVFFTPKSKEHLEWKYKTVQKQYGMFWGRIKNIIEGQEKTCYYYIHTETKVKHRLSSHGVSNIMTATWILYQFCKQIFIVHMGDK